MQASSVIRQYLHWQGSGYETSSGLGCDSVNSPPIPVRTALTSVSVLGGVNPVLTDMLNLNIHVSSKEEWHYGTSWMVGEKECASKLC